MSWTWWSCSRKLKLAPSPTCLCGPKDQTTEYVLQRCPLHKATREDVWPVSTPLMTKLYGCKQELEKTASFISQAALIMLPANAKKKYRYETILHVGRVMPFFYWQSRFHMTPGLSMTVCVILHTTVIKAEQIVCDSHQATRSPHLHMVFLTWTPSHQTHCTIPWCRGNFTASVSAR